MTNDLTVDTRDVEDIRLLYPRGFLNAHTVRVFEGELQRTLQDRCFKIVVDCSGLSYIASAGLGAIMGSIEEIRGNGGDLRLASLTASFELILGTASPPPASHRRRDYALTMYARRVGLPIMSVFA